MYAFYKYGFYILLAACTALAFSSFSTPSANENRETPKEKKSEPPPTSPAASSIPSPAPTVGPPAEETRAISFDQRYQILEEFFEEAKFRYNLLTLGVDATQLTAGAVNLFELTPQQTRSVNQVLENARHALLDERKRHSKTTILEDGSVQIAINPFIDSGNSIMEQTYRGLEKAIGPEKFARFEKMASEELNRSLQQFGAEVASYTITLKTDPDATPTFHYMRRTDTEHGYSTSSSVFEDLDHENQTPVEMRELLPKDTKQYLNDLKEAALSAR